MRPTSASAPCSPSCSPATAPIGGWAAESLSSIAAGLVDIRVDTRGEVYAKGHTRRTIRVDLLRSMRPFIVEFGLATDSELDGLFNVALAHLDDPDVIVMPAVTFLVSARKSDGT